MKSVYPKKTNEQPQIANLDNAQQKIVFAAFYNLAMSRVIGDKNSYINVWDFLKNRNDRYKKQQLSETEQMQKAKEDGDFVMQIADRFMFLESLIKWNLKNMVIPFFVRLKNQRNFFSHAIHKMQNWEDKEITALQFLQDRLCDIRTDVDKEKLKNYSLFNNDKTLSFHGSLFFVSLFLTRQDVNELLDAVEQMAGIFYKGHLSDNNKVYRLFGFSPYKIIYTFWAKRASNTDINENIPVKRFYDIVGYLRKCPLLTSVTAPEKLIEKYKIRESNFFLHYASNYFNDCKVFTKLKFEINSTSQKRLIHHGNIDFSLVTGIAPSSQQLKGYFGEEVMQRICVKHFNGEEPGSIENDFKRFMNEYFNKPIDQIDLQNIPVPSSIKKRKLFNDQQLEYRDDMLVNRLRFILKKLSEPRENELSSAQKADYIARRWTRWMLYNALKENKLTFTALPQEQFTKIRALLTNYRKNKDAICIELNNSKRLGAEVYDSAMASADLDTLYKKVMEMDMAFCKKYLNNEAERIKHYKAVASFINLKNPFEGTPAKQFNKSIALPIHKKAFNAVPLSPASTSAIELIKEYYPLHTDKFVTGIEKTAEVKAANRFNKEVWKLKQQDQILALMAFRYLTEGLRLNKRSTQVSSFSLLDLDNQLAKLNLQLSFKIGPTKVQEGNTKIIHFTFEEYKIPLNRSVLNNTKDIAFLDFFQNKAEINFAELEPLLLRFKESQFKMIEKVLLFEEQFLNRFPSLKNLPSPGEKHLKFRHIMDKADEKLQFNSCLQKFITQNNDYAVLVNTSNTNFGKEWVIEFRNAALHNKLPVINGKIHDDFFAPCIAFIDSILINELKR